jgi:hypothetical protein
MTNTFETDGASSSTAEPPTSFHGWNPLPTELKLEVLSHFILSKMGGITGPGLCLPYTVNAELHRENLSRCLFPLFHTRNRELANLVQDVCYKRNIFHIALGIWYHKDRYEGETGLFELGTRSGIRYPKAAVAGMTQNVVVTAYECNVWMTLEDMMMESDAGWRWLVRPLRLLDREHFIGVPSRACGTPNPATDTQWQLGFTNLQQLRIEIQAFDGIYQYQSDGQRGVCCNLGPDRLATLVRLLEETEILLREKRVQLLCSPSNFVLDICDSRYPV